MRFWLWLLITLVVVLTLTVVAIQLYAPIFLHKQLVIQAASAGLDFSASKVHVSILGGNASIKDIYLKKADQEKPLCAFKDLRITFSLPNLLMQKGEVDLEIIGPGEVNLPPQTNPEEGFMAPQGQDDLINIGKIKLSKMNFSAFVAAEVDQPRHIALYVENGQFGISKPALAGAKEIIHGRLDAKDIFLEGRLISKRCIVETTGAIIGRHLQISKFILKLPEYRADINLSGYVGEIKGKKRYTLSVTAQSDLKKLYENLPVDAFPDGARKIIDAINARFEGIAELKADVQTPGTGIPTITGYLDLSGVGILLADHFRKNKDVTASLGFEVEINIQPAVSPEIKVKSIDAVCGPVSLHAALSEPSDEELRITFKTDFTEPLHLREYYDALEQISPILSDLVIVEGSLAGDLLFKRSENRNTLTDARINLDRMILNHPQITEGPLVISGRFIKSGSIASLRGLQFSIPHTMVILDGDADMSNGMQNAEFSLYVPKMDAFRTGGLAKKTIKLLKARNKHSTPATPSPALTKQKNGAPDIKQYIKSIRAMLKKHRVEMSLRADDIDLSGFGMALKTASVAFSISPEDISIDRVSFGLRQGIIWLRANADLREELPKYSVSIGGARLQVPFLARDLVRVSETLEQHGLIKEGDLKFVKPVGPTTKPAAGDKLPVLFYGSVSYDGGPKIMARNFRIKMPGLNLYANAGIYLKDNSVHKVSADFFIPELNCDVVAKTLNAFAANVALESSGTVIREEDVFKALEKMLVNVHLRADNISKPSKGLKPASVSLMASLDKLHANLERLDVRTARTAFRISGSSRITKEGPRKVRLEFVGPSFEVQETQMQMKLLFDALTSGRFSKYIGRNRQAERSTQGDPEDIMSELRKMDVVADIRLNNITIPELVKNFKSAAAFKFNAREDRLDSDLSFDFGHSLLNVSASIQRLSKPKRKVDITVMAPFIDLPKLKSESNQVKAYVTACLSHLLPKGDIAPRDGANTSPPPSDSDNGDTVIREALKGTDLHFSAFAGQVHNAHIEHHPVGEIKDLRIEVVNDKEKLRLRRFRFNVFRGNATLDNSFIDYSQSPPVALFRIELEGLRPNNLLRKVVDEHFYHNMSFEGEFAFSGTVRVPLAHYDTVKGRVENYESKMKTLGDARWWVTLGTIKGHTTPRHIRNIFPLLDYQLYNFESVVGIITIDGLNRKNVLFFKGLEGYDLEIRGKSNVTLSRENDKDILLTNMSYDMLADLRNTLSLDEKQTATADIGKIPLLKYKGNLIRRRPRQFLDDLEVNELSIQWRPEEQILSLLRDNVLMPAKDILGIALIQTRIADIVTLPAKLVLDIFKKDGSKKEKQR